jgi:acetoin utilization protein AcuB
MRVADVMQSKVVTMSPRATVPAAERLMREHGVRHVPIVDGEKLLGIVSARDLARALPSPATSLARHEITGLLDRLTVEEIMSRPAIVVEPSRALDDALRLMLVEGISALPVTEAGHLVGLLTEADALELLVGCLRATAPSSRLEVALGDQPGALGHVVATVEEAGAPITNLVTFRPPHERRRAMVSVATIDPRPAVAALSGAGYDVGEPWPVARGRSPIPADRDGALARASGPGGLGPARPGGCGWWEAVTASRLSRRPA